MAWQVTELLSGAKIRAEDKLSKYECFVYRRQRRWV